MNRNNVTILNIIREHDLMMHNDDRFLATAKLLVFLISLSSPPPSLPLFASIILIVQFSPRVSHFDYVHFIQRVLNPTTNILL